MAEMNVFCLSLHVSTLHYVNTQGESYQEMYCLTKECVLNDSLKN